MFISPNRQLDLPSRKAWKSHFETILGEALGGTAFSSQASSLIVAGKWYNLINKQKIIPRMASGFFFFFKEHCSNLVK